MLVRCKQKLSGLSCFIRMGGGLCAVISTGIPFAFAQAEITDIKQDKSGYAVAESLPVIEVTGKRASLASAQEIKQEKIEIVDSVVAEDINKLPDINVTDALARVTGVQILQDRGEGSGVAIRGLTQMETTLNGREVFTAGSGRTINFADLPSEMVAGIDVYKTSSAEHLEGGVGGTIDLRTRRPFDFEGKEFSASVRSIYGDLVKKNEPQFSMLMSNRWQTESGGEFGVLADVAYQKRAWREDQKSEGNPLTRTNLISGQTVIAPNGTTETTSAGTRERTSFDTVLQWKATPALELYAEGSYVKFLTLQDSYQINVTPSSSSSFVAGSPQLFAGSNNLQSITWTNAPVSILSYARDTVDETKQLAIGGIWKENADTVKADVSRTESYNNLYFAGTILGGTAANFTQNLSGGIPATSVSGTNLLDPANLKYTGLMYREQPYLSDLTTASMDAERELDSGLLNKISSGLRLARRTAGNSPGLIFGDKSLSSLSSASAVANPYSDFFPGSNSIGNYLTGDMSNARNASALYNSFGITTALPTSGNPLSVWNISEETQAAYLMAKFTGMDAALDGSAGLRAVRTQEIVTGSQSVPSSGSLAPIDINSAYIDYLPSANLRYKVKEGLYLRGALSKTITRPDFNQLSPSLTLLPNSVNPSLNSGSAGNPALNPVRSNNLDLAVERYLNETTSVYVTGFFKQVDGFLATVSSPETYNGVTYQVSRPQNSNPANIRGFETGYQQFYDFLPGWMKGLGLQANYTYVDSDTPNSTLGVNAPLQNLSKNSYNLVGMYEKDEVSARIAYNWRDKFMSGVTNIVGVGALPIYTAAYGWLDASVAYKYTKQITFALEGTNLLRTVRTSYYGIETQPQSVWINDRQVSVSMNVRY